MKTKASHYLSKILISVDPVNFIAPERRVAASFIAKLNVSVGTLSDILAIAVLTRISFERTNKGIQPRTRTRAVVRVNRQFECSSGRSC